MMKVFAWCDVSINAFGMMYLIVHVYLIESTVALYFHARFILLLW